MLLDFIAALATGFGLLSVTFILNRVTGQRLGRWIYPATVAAGMVGYTAWAEYTWHSRVLAAQPQLRLASTASERLFYRPWTYVVPQINRMIAVDVSQSLQHDAQPDLILTHLVLMGRWEPTRSIPVIFNCAENTRADLLEGATLNPDGTVEGVEWATMAADDRILVTACELAEEMRRAASS